MKTYLIPLLIVCCFCTKKRKEEPCIGCNSLPISETFVLSYDKAGSLNLDDKKQTFPDGRDYLALAVKPKRSYPFASRDTFNLYARLFNDKGFNRYSETGSILIDTISNVTVTTIFDLDGSHKKGDSINDLVALKYRMVYDYIQSGYTNGGSNQFSYIGESTLILTEFNKKEKLMVKSDWIFLQMPQINPKPPKQQYAVHMRFTNGKVISDTTSVFE